jgi:hypothetical protein
MGIRWGRFSLERSGFGISRSPRARYLVRLHVVDPPHDRPAVGSEVSYGLTLCNQLENC